MSQAAARIPTHTSSQRPRVAFVGVGSIGLKRFQAIAETEVVKIVAVQDVQISAAFEAQKSSRCVSLFSSFEEVLNEYPDGIVIATPNALHAEQAIAALELGIAVFCQKPLGRDAGETRAVVDAARKSNSLLGVDLSYRFIPGMQRISELVQSGVLGKIFAVDLKFYNGYGPDKPWFYDRAVSGGGCVIDLGTHLIDLALRPLGFPGVTSVSSSLFKRGRLLRKPCEEIEDFALARIDVKGDVVLNLACLWNSNIGSHVTIEVLFHGTEGAAALRNVPGSFYDFTAERYEGTQKESLNFENNSGNKWGGLAALDWCRRVASGGKFDPDSENLVVPAGIIDQIYGRVHAAF
jgi:predicted dehydrogenase